MLLISLILVLHMTVFEVHSSQCSFPAPAANFKNEDYTGKWYEIGKVQTAGGAFFERKCVCTELNIAINNDPGYGDGYADNDCRKSEVDGKWTNATGALTNEDPQEPGRWLETIGVGSPVNYTVIALGSDYAVEYDCGTSFGITNYCIHVMSRTRTMDETQFKELMQMAFDMGLNPNDLDIKMTLQDGCL